MFAQPLPADAGKLPEAVLQRIFEQSQEAVLITDTSNRIVAVNTAFTRLTGYAADEVLGQNPGVLASGRNTPEFYAEMWQTLQRCGGWQGEIWDKRKDGSMYPKWLSISSIADESGTVTHYVANFTDITASKEATARLTHLAYHDPLTGLPNRLAFETQLSQAIATCDRQGKQMALMLIDLDNFKNINDSLGHHVGDELLQKVAVRLRQSLRSSDLVARLGGDEFVVLLPDLDDPLIAARIAAKLQGSLADSYQVAEHILYATPSIGIGLYPDDGPDPGTLLRNADTAMYYAKKAGRNNHQFYAPKMNACAGERLQLENTLRHAIASMAPGISEFALHFQPQIDAGSSRVTAVEALLRWTSPKLGSISPARFIPVAEESGLMQPLGDWVIWEACHHARAFRDAGLDIRVSINVSAQQLRHENLLLLIQGAMTCYDLVPGDIELEITESAVMQNPDKTLALLHQIAATGITLAIDDFGTGYSSLAYLKHMPIRRLKLDRSFVKDLESNHSDAAICSATIALGHKLGLELVAEGIETPGQQAYLRQQECDLLQGFLFSKPLPAEQLIAFVKAQAEHSG